MKHRVVSPATVLCVCVRDNLIRPSPCHSPASGLWGVCAEDEPFFFQRRNEARGGMSTARVPLSLSHNLTTLERGGATAHAHHSAPQAHSAPVMRLCWCFIATAAPLPPCSWLPSLPSVQVPPGWAGGEQAPLMTSNGFCSLRGTRTGFPLAEIGNSLPKSVTYGQVPQTIPSLQQV